MSQILLASIGIPVKFMSRVPEEKKYQFCIEPLPYHVYKSQRMTSINLLKLEMPLVGTNECIFCQYIYLQSPEESCNKMATYQISQSTNFCISEQILKQENLQTSQTFGYFSYQNQRQVYSVSQRSLSSVSLCVHTVRSFCPQKM